MTRFHVLTAIMFVSIATPSFADLSGYAPDQRMIGRDDAKTICNSMGDAGKGYNLEGNSGAYGCQNLTNGNAIACNGDGQCTDHVGDPRWRRIKELIDGAGKKDGSRRL